MGMLSKSVLALSATAVAADNLKGFLNPNDAVAISFWIISIAMVAATVFFLMESMAVGAHWKTSMNVGALVTLVAAVHYFYMREYWVQIGKSPIVYRYIDWSAPLPCWHSAMLVRPATSRPSPASSLASADGSTSSTRSSRVRPARWPPLAARWACT